jgi:hypothetical protein
MVVLQNINFGTTPGATLPVLDRSTPFGTFSKNTYLVDIYRLCPSRKVGFTHLARQTRYPVKRLKGASAHRVLRDIYQISSRQDASWSREMNIFAVGSLPEPLSQSL